jgi:hypothetical protein
MHCVDRMQSCSVLSACIYRVPQEERSVFWEVIVSAILSKQKKNVYVHVSYLERFPG